MESHDLIDSLVKHIAGLPTTPDLRTLDLWRDLPSYLSTIPEQERRAVLDAVVGQSYRRVADLVVALVKDPVREAIWTQLLDRYRRAHANDVGPFVLAAALAADPTTRALVPSLLGDRMRLSPEHFTDPVAMAAAAEIHDLGIAAGKADQDRARKIFKLRSATPVLFVTDPAGPEVVAVTDKHVLQTSGRARQPERAIALPELHDYSTNIYSVVNGISFGVVAADGTIEVWLTDEDSRPVPRRRVNSLAHVMDRVQQVTRTISALQAEPRRP